VADAPTDGETGAAVEMVNQAHRPAAGS